MNPREVYAAWNRGELTEEQVSEWAGQWYEGFLARQARRHLSVWVPALPRRALSANGGGRSRRDPFAVQKAKDELGEATYHAILATCGPNLPTFEPPVVITCTLYARHHTHNGDGLYRPQDPSNIGGDILKPIIDTLKPLGVIGDDNYWDAEKRTGWVREVRLRVAHVDTLEAEGILLEVAGA